MTKELTDCQFADKVSVSLKDRSTVHRYLTGMYAIDPQGGVYHLANETQDRTLCGLIVPPIIINRPTSSATIYLTELEPEDQELCKACRKVQSERNFGES